MHIRLIFPREAHKDVYVQAVTKTAIGSKNIETHNINNNNNCNNDLLTDPLGGSSLLNYINYNYKINRI